MLKLNNLQSIIEHFEQSRENLKGILTEQGSTLFHSFDYYEGELNIVNDVIVILKMYQSHEQKELDRLGQENLALAVENKILKGKEKNNAKN